MQALLSYFRALREEVHALKYSMLGMSALIYNHILHGLAFISHDDFVTFLTKQQARSGVQTDLAIPDARQAAIVTCLKQNGLVETRGQLPPGIPERLDLIADPFYSDLP